MRTTRRREFLKVAGAGLATAAGTGLPIPAVGEAGSRNTLRRLARRLRGPLVLPGSSSFPAAAQVWNQRFDLPPRAVAFCETSSDVAEVVRFARDREWSISARSGRHSFEGYCNAKGIVADVSRLDNITVDRSAGTVKIGTGASVLSIYEGLFLPYDLAIPTGSCPTVGIAGLTLGGGFSRYGRMHGFTLDSLVEAKVVLPDGRIVRCNERHRPNLFWALRGAGGGNFGVVTQFTFKLLPTPDVVDFSLAFNWTQGAQVFDAWQRSVPFAPQALSVSTFRATKSPPPSGSGPDHLKVGVGGQFYGSESDLTDLLAPLIALGPTGTSIETVPFLKAWVPESCQLQPNNTVTCAPSDLGPNYQRSDFVNKPISAQGIETLLSQIEQWPGSPTSHEGGVQVEAFGPPAATNRIRKDATAWVHRDSLFHICYLNFWGPTDPPAVAKANIAWANQIYAAMRPYVSGFAYQNYIDRGLGSWQEAYYGSNYPRLRRIKRHYDPDNLFHFRQGIKLAR